MSLQPVGFKDLQRELVELAERAGDARPALEQVADEFRQAQRANFAVGGRPRWKPLTPEYAARKAAAGISGGIGVYTGGLRDSLLREGDRYHLSQVRPDELRVGTTNPVARLFNAKHKARNQPKRKVVRLTPADRRGYLDLVQQHLAGTL